MENRSFPGRLSQSGAYSTVLNTGLMFTRLYHKETLEKAVGSNTAARREGVERVVR